MSQRSSRVPLNSLTLLYEDSGVASEISEASERSHFCLKNILLEVHGVIFSGVKCCVSKFQNSIDIP